MMNATSEYMHSHTHTHLVSYFESGVCSVYLWDLDHGFAGVVLIKKAGDTEKTKGCWDSIHVVEVQVSPGSIHVEVLKRYWVALLHCFDDYYYKCSFQYASLPGHVEAD